MSYADEELQHDPFINMEYKLGVTLETSEVL